MADYFDSSGKQDHSIACRNCKSLIIFFLVNVLKIGFLRNYVLTSLGENDKYSTEFVIRFLWLNPIFPIFCEGGGRLEFFNGSGEYAVR